MDPDISGLKKANSMISTAVALAQILDSCASTGMHNKSTEHSAAASNNKCSPNEMMLGQPFVSVDSTGSKASVYSRYDSSISGPALRRLGDRYRVVLEMVPNIGGRIRCLGIATPLAEMPV